MKRVLHVGPPPVRPGAPDKGDVGRPGAFMDALSRAEAAPPDGVHAAAASAGVRAASMAAHLHRPGVWLDAPALPQAAVHPPDVPEPTALADGEASAGDASEAVAAVDAAGGGTHDGGASAAADGVVLGSPPVGTPLTGTPLTGTPFPEAPFPEAPFPEAPFPEAPFPEAPFPEAPFPEAPLAGSRLSEALVRGATTPAATLRAATEREATVSAATVSAATVSAATTEQGVTERGVTEQGVTERGVTERGVTERGVTGHGLNRAEVGNAEAGNAEVTQAEVTQAEVQRWGALPPGDPRGVPPRETDPSLARGDGGLARGVAGGSAAGEVLPKEVAAAAEPGSSEVAARAAVVRGAPAEEARGWAGRMASAAERPGPEQQARRAAAASPSAAGADPAAGRAKQTPDPARALFDPPPRPSHPLRSPAGPHPRDAAAPPTPGGPPSAALHHRPPPSAEPETAATTHASKASMRDAEAAETGAQPSRSQIEDTPSAHPRTAAQGGRGPLLQHAPPQEAASSVVLPEPMEEGPAAPPSADFGAPLPEGDAPRDLSARMAAGLRWRLVQDAKRGHLARVSVPHPTLGTLEFEFAQHRDRLDVRAAVSSLVAAMTLREEEDDLRRMLDRHGTRLEGLRVHIAPKNTSASAARGPGPSAAPSPGRGEVAPHNAGPTHERPVRVKGPRPLLRRKV